MPLPSVQVKPPIISQRRTQMLNKKNTNGLLLEDLEEVVAPPNSGDGTLWFPAIILLILVGGAE
ncbi:hypothetical protein [Nostoc sp. PCC 9305]|uniref:hypothetical protein n=1 Tax=Nostoc sp. PCC 9305 TaxID=296636 RepID=UPI0039C5EDE9